MADRFAVEPGRTITLEGRPIFRLAHVITESGARAISPSELDRVAHVVAEALAEASRVGLHLDLTGG